MFEFVKTLWNLYPARIGVSSQFITGCRFILFNIAAIDRTLPDGHVYGCYAMQIPINEKNYNDSPISTTIGIKFWIIQCSYLNP